MRGTLRAFSGLGKLTLVVSAFFLVAASLHVSLSYSAAPTPAEDVQVRVADYSYTPSALNVEAGTTVTWTNSGKDIHNIAIDRGPEAFVSVVLTPGKTVKFVFTTPGKYHYFCEWHANMQGDVDVRGPNGSNVAPAPPAARTFAETGKTLRGKFLQYWDAHGGLAQQGFPLSEEMAEKSDTDGKFYTVQYFERAVFELHPDNRPPNDVLLSLLGNFLYKQKYPNGAPGQQPNTSAGSVLFKETGKRVGGRFLQYWQESGGLPQQGFPISDEFMEKSQLDGKTYRVQYFERAVFELHPENKPPYDVLLSQLGTFRYKSEMGGDQEASQGVRQVGISAGPQHYPLLAGPHAAAGLNVWIYENDPKPVVDMVQDLKAKWVLHQLSWYQVEPQKGVYKWEKLDRAVEAMSKAGLYVVLHPVHAPEWAWATDRVGYPKDPEDFGRFMTVVAQRYKGKVAGYQVWNEPNFAHETGLYASTSHYGALLKIAYNAVKAVDPKAVVVLGALTPTGLNDPYKAVDDVEFLRRLYAYNSGELKGYFDVLGAHPGSNANPPEALYPEQPGPGPGWNNHASFYFRRVEQLRQVMLDNGDGQKQVWLTEFGWTSVEKPAEGFEYAAQN
ncbi:MAG TPA: cupredoxin domain-containing protein, partial [Chloroflexia bacterium]|nr:cupredoxin domain-containing protein [Chloroflexia bacterium]